MLPRNHPERVVSDDHRWWPMPVCSSRPYSPGIWACVLVDHQSWAARRGGPTPEDKLMTLVASAMAGGDCIDERRWVAHRGDGLHPGRHGQGAIHPGDLPAQLPVGPRPPAGPGEPGAAGPGLGRWGHLPGDALVHHRPRFHHLRDLRTGQGEAPATTAIPASGATTRCWPSAAGTGDVLMSRLREGRANTARGAAHFLRETVGRVRYAGANGRLTLRADSGFYTHGVVSVCRKMDVRFSITIRQHKSLRNLIEAIPEEPGLPFPTGWTAPPMWPRPPALPSRVNLTPHRCGSSSGV